MHIWYRLCFDYFFLYTGTCIYIYVYVFLFYHAFATIGQGKNTCLISWLVPGLLVDMFLKGPHHENCQGHQALRRVPPFTGQTLRDPNFVTVITSCLRGKYLRMLDKQCRMLTFLTGIHDFHEEQFFFNKECLLPWGMIYFMKNIFSTKKL